MYPLGDCAAVCSSNLEARRLRHRTCLVAHARPKASGRTFTHVFIHRYIDTNMHRYTDTYRCEHKKATSISIHTHRHTDIQTPTAPHAGGCARGEIFWGRGSLSHSSYPPRASVHVSACFASRSNQTLSAAGIGIAKKKARSIYRLSLCFGQTWPARVYNVSGRGSCCCGLGCVCCCCRCSLLSSSSSSS